MDAKKIQEQINELKLAINRDNTLGIIDEHIECLSHCPTNDNYRLWLFKYKDIVVLLEDTENGTYRYVSCINDR